MTRIQLFLFGSIFLLTLTIACSDLSNEQGGMINETADSTVENPPPLPKMYYGDLNFIVDSIGTIYFHDKNDNWMHCTGRLDQPRFMQLKPTDLRIIKSDSLASLIKSIVGRHEYPRMYLPEKGESGKAFIGSEYIIRCMAVIQFADSTRIKELSEIEIALYQSKILIRSMMPLTEETSHVLIAKQKGTPYLPSKIKWSDNFYFKPDF